ncbi:MFS transporter [Pedococcus sp. KACC 23699]|uniref:MFS transporter n=1 Tax=Pedococcus sp. KACC 23699 TaxID=3149228 RepID=A0AAU7JWI8_9MICO
MTEGAAGEGRLTRRDWWALLSLSLGSFAVVAAEFVPVGILPELSEELRVSVGTAGLCVLVPGLVAGVSAPPLVAWLASWDRRHLVLALGLLLLASSLIAALTTSFPVLLAARALVGLSLGGFWAVVPSLGFRMAPPGSGPVATSVILAGISVGTVVGLPAGQYLGEEFGWRAAFWATASLALVSLVVQSALVPHVEPVTSLRFRDLAGVLRSRLARVGYAATVLVVTGQFAASTFVSPFLMGPGELDSSALTGLLTAYGVCGFVGTLVAGRLLGRHPVSTTVTAMACLALAIGVLPVVARWNGAVAAAMAFWGLLWGVMPLCLQTWIIRAWPQAPEAASAVLVSVLQVSIAGGALVGGVAVDHLGLAVDFTVGAALVLAGAAYTSASSRGTGVGG